MGLNVLGDWNSPVMPIMMFKPSTLLACSREMLKRGVAVVVVGFPACPLLTARVRVCISACHTKEDLDFALDMFRDVTDFLDLGFGTQSNAMHLDEARKAGFITAM